MLEFLISFFQDLNNREAAIGIWILIILILGLTKHEIRNSFFLVVKAFFVRKLLISHLLMFSYIIAMLFLLHVLGIWQFTHIANTVLWIICVAFVMLFDCLKANDESFLKNAIKDNLKALVFLEFFINLYVFSLWIELILFPVLSFLGMMQAFAKSNKEYEPAQKALTGTITIIGTFLGGYALYMVISNFSTLFTLGNFENFFLPILLTILFLPFIYSYALYANYESLFTRLSFFTSDKQLLSYLKKKTILAFKLNLWILNKWSKHVIRLRFKDKNSIDSAIHDFKNSN